MPGMADEVDRDTAVPPYRQVAGFLRAAIERGDYAPGQRLPSVTDLVQIYGVARLTAAKALRVLIDDGVAVMSPGLGTFVRGDLPRGQNRGT